MITTYNRITLIGIVSSISILRKTKNKVKNVDVTNFILTTIESSINKETGKVNNYHIQHKITCWGEMAQRAVNILHEKDKILIEGILSYDKSNSANIKVTKLELMEV